ncbi:hypothetical protein COP2_025067 [Malus domestica]
MVLLKLKDGVLYQLLANTCQRAARKVRNYGSLVGNSPPLTSPQKQPFSFPNFTMCNLEGRDCETIACDIFGSLLKSQSVFPYFMLVAFEGGSIFRALLLLLSYPVLLIFDYEHRLRVMIFITFCGLRKKDMESVGRAVLPKFYQENLNLQAYEVFASAGFRVVLTSVPRVMVEHFLKDYMEVGDVLGTELHTVGHYFTGLLSSSGFLVKHNALKKYFGDKRLDIGIGSSSVEDNLFISLCKEAYVVNKEDNKSATNSAMPRHKQPKPVIFHDGRLAFLPTPSATLAMFLWLPLGIILAILRISVGIILPCKIALFLTSLTGVNLSVKGCLNPTSSNPQKKGVLYVCTHRTLLDPVFLSMALGKPLTAVTYSLSKMSEIIAPIKTVRLTRDRKQDGETMGRLLSEGDLVVCPEGTTCREPYLLRFSSLFAELADEIVPVAINTNVSMFYGTTASGLKCLDPIFFLMNPGPAYYIEVLGRLPRELTCAGGKSSNEVANYIQRKLADALGFECTSLTRRDKYLMLAGNEGIVPDNKRKKP